MRTLFKFMSAVAVAAAQGVVDEAKLVFSNIPNQVKEDIREIKSDIELIKRMRDSSNPRTLRLSALGRIKNPTILLRCSLGEYDVDFALVAVLQIEDQAALAIIQRYSPFISVRERAEQRSARFRSVKPTSMPTMTRGRRALSNSGRARLFPLRSPRTNN